MDSTGFCATLSKKSEVGVKMNYGRKFWMNFSPNSLKLEMVLGDRWANNASAFLVRELDNIWQQVLYKASSVK